MRLTPFRYIFLKYILILFCFFFFIALSIEVVKQMNKKEVTKKITSTNIKKENSNDI